MKKAEIARIYKTADVAKIPNGHKLLLISINKTVQDGTIELYDKVRYSWRLSPERADGRLVLATAFGLILGVYEAEKWLKATIENFGEIPGHHGNWSRQKGRFGFRGREVSEADAKPYRYKRVPEGLRNHGSPIRYVD